MTDGIQSINERREELESLAESDLPCAEVAAALLEVADES